MIINLTCSQLLLVSTQHSTFHQTFHDDDAVVDMEDSEHLFALETQPMTEERGPDAQILSSKYITIVALNNAFTSTQRKRCLSVLVNFELRCFFGLDVWFFF